MKKYFVFDVESIGLHGEPYAVGFVVVNSEGLELASKSFAVFPQLAHGDADDRQWVESNIPELPISHDTIESMLDAFWVAWLFWKEQGAMMCAECAWPVEAKFLSMCAGREWPKHKWNGPYPLIDVSSVMMAKGNDPRASYPRKDSEMPAHDPLRDARQSARLLIEALSK